jgi:hypothetical protein
MCLEKWHPPTRPPLTLAAVRRVFLACGPSHGQIIVHRLQLEEVPLMHFRLCGPHVVALDSQSVDNTHGETCLLPHLAHDGSRRRLIRLDRARWHLNTGHFERYVIMREHKQQIITDDVSDDLSNEPALLHGAHP